MNIIEPSNCAEPQKYVAGPTTELCRAIAGLKFRGVPRFLYATAPTVLGTEARIFELDSGLKLVLDPTDYFQCMMFYEWFSPEIVDVFRRLVRPGDVVLDIGAHLGYFSQHLAQLVTARGRVFCFEPDPRALSRLDCGLNAAGMSWVNVSPMAMTDHDGQMDFYISPTMGWSTAARSKPLKSIAQITVKTASVDGLVAQGQLPRAIRLVKIDVEGLELQVLRGMCQTLERIRPFLIMEINPAMLLGNGTTPALIMDLLNSLRYRVCRIEKNTRWWRTRPEAQIRVISSPPTDDCDVLCVPEEVHQSRLAQIPFA